MSIEPPQIVLRYGAHAEKEYFLKLAGQYDGIMFGANLLEITPTATASLLAVLRNNHTSLGFYLDPMTYCFGPYIDPSTGKTRTDLDALKSTRTDRKTRKKFTAVKDSYTSLAAALGSRFDNAVNDGASCTAIDPSSIPEEDRDDFCESVVKYQLQRVNQLIEPELADDQVLKAKFDGIGAPAAVFAPYFYVHERWADDGLAISMDLARRSVDLNLGTPVHAVVCANDALLSDDERVDHLVRELPKTKVEGVWLWFDGFDELTAPLNRLQAFRRIVLALGQEMSVYNLHGGFFSMLLTHDGLSGISHGVGYGERSDVAKVIGVAAPTVRYYLPPIRKRVGVPDIQRCFSDVGIATASDFFEKVCDCAICNGVIGSDLGRFAAFGQMHRANPDSKRDSQTPTAAKMCRFHFLLNRFKEREFVASLGADERVDHLANSAAPWRACYPLRQHLGHDGADGYIERWTQALSVTEHD